MRFGPNVVEHAPFSIPMIGNTATGYSIGLTPEGAAVCHRMFSEDVTEAEVAAVHADLPAHLRRGGFVVEDVEADDVTLGKGVEGVERAEGVGAGMPLRLHPRRPRPLCPRRCSRRTCTSPTIAT